MSVVGAIARCLLDYFPKQFELSDIVTLQTGHVVRRVSFWSNVVVKRMYCSVDSSVIVLYIINIKIVAICNISLSSEKNYIMHSNLVHLGVVETIRKFVNLEYYGVGTGQYRVASSSHSDGKLWHNFFVQGTHTHLPLSTQEYK